MKDAGDEVRADETRPEYLYMGGRVRPWAEGTVHVWSEVVIRAASIFEGLRAYRQPDSTLSAVMVDRHMHRLMMSARLLRIPHTFTPDDVFSACRQLADAVAEDGADLYLRPTLFIEQGRYAFRAEDVESDLFVTAFPLPRSSDKRLRLGVSTWQRASDVSFPARLKSAANYQVVRLARVEAAQRGLDEIILLNSAGRVAEASGACVLVVRDGVVSSPLASEGALESITLGVVERLCSALDVPFVRRPVDRTELLVADEIGICGTLGGIQIAGVIDGEALSASSTVLETLQRAYVDAVQGRAPRDEIQMTPL